MAAQRQTHPSAEVLKALALGKLNDSSSDAVLVHLDSCPDCCKQVATQSGDDFLNRLRQARGSSFTPAPAKSLSDVSRAANPPVSGALVPNLPPELAANPQYEILRELGRGGMGVVYLAKNKLMDRLEVLKVVNKALLDHPGAVERFLREIRSAAKLSHPNVVGAHHALQMGEVLAFTMEYVEGQDLASLVKSQGPLPVPHACFYVQQAASGLQHAFEKQMVHRDIKPQNLILAREGKKHIVKVLDFGLAKVMREKSDDTGLTGEGKMLGTPDYIAPEQTLDAAKADIRADIYSLGCTLYYLLSGHPPFSASSLGAILVAHQMHEAKPLNLERPEVPEELAAVVRKMMAKTPAKRYQTPLEVVQALSPFVKQGATLPKASPELSASVVEAKPVVKAAAPVAPPPAPAAKEAKPPEPEGVWGSLTEGSAASTVSRKSAIVRNPRAATVRERTSQKKWLLGGGLSVGVLLLALLGMWAGGMFEGKVVVKTKDGIIVIEVTEPNPYVYVDGEKATVKWQNGGKKAEIRVKPGTHKVEVKKDGFTVDGTELTFKDGDKEIFKARLLPDKPVDKAEPPAPEQTPPVPDKGFVSLFNGKDNTGWKTHLKQPGNWRVENGILIGSGPAISHLYSERGDYKDFHLRVEARINDGGNSGVCFRATFGPKFPVNDPQFPFGYEAQINSTHGDINKTGSLYVVGEGAVFTVRESLVPPEKWFTMEVIAQGDRIIVKVDSKTTVDFTDEQRRLFTSGDIALQHNPGAVAEFRKIEIKELSPAAASSEPPRQAAKEKDSFFNEKDLTGWEGLTKYWSVKDGSLVGYRPEASKHKTFLSSKKQYRDFELKFKVRLKDGVGNSGVQIRSKLVDPQKFIVTGPQCDIGAPYWGSLYGEGFGGMMKQSPPDLVGKAVRLSDFNDYSIKCVGKHVTIKINDETMVDDDFPTMPDEGIIAWQLQAGFNLMEVTFKDIQFKELLPRQEAVDAARTKDGWVQLFNGKDLTGWHASEGTKARWRVAGETLVGSGQIGFLVTDRSDFADFRLRVEAMLGEGGDSGVCFRVQDREVRLAYEAQIGAGLPRLAAHTGSFVLLDGQGSPILAHAPQAVPPDRWFVMEILAQGNRFTIWVDGKQAVQYEDREKRYSRGAIALQHIGRQSVVSFRKVEIQELPASKSETPLATKSESPRATAGAAKEKDFVPLFDGKTSKGWRTHPKQPGNWRVEKGVIIGSGPAISHLYSERGDYKDFHLRVEARINDGGNSGVDFRSPFGPQLPTNEPGYPAGYEAQINSTQKDPNKTGSLYDGGDILVGVPKSPVPSGEWFTLEVSAEGNHIVIKVNGQKTADYTDEKRRHISGHLVLKQDFPLTVAEFRKIEIKELSATKSEIPPAAKPEGPPVSRPDREVGEQKRAAITPPLLKNEIKKKGKGKVSKTASGLKYEDLVEGTGAAAVHGDNVEVHYTGWLTNGKKFDSSVDRKTPLLFKLGAGEVIKGWEEGVAGMKVGGKRKLTIPPELAYGKRGVSGAIPPDARLIFEIELLKIK